MNEYILGLNGWFDRSHDGSACIIQNGKILAMAEEERFIRKKHAYDKIPYNSTLWCLEKVGINLDKIDRVAVGWEYKTLYHEAKITEPKLNNLVDIFFPKKYFRYTRQPKIELIPHHLAHAASSFYLSGMKEASIIVIDGQGEKASTTFAVGRNKNIKILWSLPIESSLGYFYEAVSDFIGLGSAAAGKTMGLAPYGKAKYNFDQFVLNKTGYDVKIDFPKKEKTLDQQSRILKGWRDELTKKVGHINPVKYRFRDLYGDIQEEVTLTDVEKDLASSAQETLERIILHCAKILIKKTGLKNLCLAGGVALNCSANARILHSGIIDNLFIPPFANDAGVSAGAALLVCHRKITGEKLEQAYLGTSYSDRQIKIALDKLGCKYSQNEGKIEKVVASLLDKGKIISWFQDQMEVGPRALGNRSIIANPTFSDMHQKVNESKGRERWRPLAPSILEEEINEYLEKAVKSPFMLYAFNVLPLKRKKIPAVVHVDGSTRPQTVNERNNQRYYHLIKCFKKLSGVPLILNTSFNGPKEAIVCTPFDALNSFYSNSTDYLAMGSFLIKK